MSKQDGVAGFDPTAWQKFMWAVRDPLYFVEGLLNVGEQRVVNVQVAKMKLAEKLDPDIGRPGHAMSVKEVLEANNYDWDTGKQKPANEPEPDAWRDLMTAAKGGAR